MFFLARRLVLLSTQVYEQIIRYVLFIFYSNVLHFMTFIIVDELALFSLQINQFVVMSRNVFTVRHETKQLRFYVRSTHFLLQNRSNGRSIIRQKLSKCHKVNTGSIRLRHQLFHIRLSRYYIHSLSYKFPVQHSIILPLLSPFISFIAGIGFWYDFVLGGKHCRSTERTLRFPLNCCWKARCPIQLYNRQSNI